MGLSWELYKQALLIFKPTEETSKVLDHILSLCLRLGIKHLNHSHTAPVFLMQLTINHISLR